MSTISNALNKRTSVECISICEEQRPQEAKRKVCGRQPEKLSEIVIHDFNDEFGFSMNILSYCHGKYLLIKINT